MQGTVGSGVAKYSARFSEIWRAEKAARQQLAGFPQVTFANGVVEREKSRRTKRVFARLCTHRYAFPR